MDDGDVVSEIGSSIRVARRVVDDCGTMPTKVTSVSGEPKLHLSVALWILIGICPVKGE